VLDALAALEVERQALIRGALLALGLDGAVAQVQADGTLIYHSSDTAGGSPPDNEGSD